MTDRSQTFKKQVRLFMLVGIIAATAFSFIIYAVSTMTGRMAHEEALERAREAAYHYAFKLGDKISDAMSISRTIARTLESGMRHRDRIDRELYDRFFIEILEKSDRLFFGTWAVFEPNRFDGRDREFAGRKGYEKNGDYIPYAYRKPEGIVFKHDLYEIDHLQNYYTIPTKTKRECVIDPYVEPDAENVVMCSVAVPVMDSGEVVGVAGIDILLSSLNSEIASIKPFEKGYVFLTGNNGFIVGHPNSSFVGKNISEIGFSDSVAVAVKSGLEFFVEKEDTQAGELYQYFFVPLRIGATNSSWSLCVAFPLSTIMQKAHSITNLTVMVGFAAMSLLAFLLILLARQVIVPLKQSEENMRRMFDHVHDAVIIHTAAGEILDANDQMLTLYGITREDLLKYTIKKDLSGPDNPFDDIAGIWENVMAGRPRYFTWKARRPGTGEEFDAEVYLDRMELFETPVVVATIRDITERKKMEAEQLKSTKLESLGTLAGGIAHDFNNFLMGITGNLMLAKKRVQPNEKLFEILTRAEAVAFKAKALAEQLITFSKGGMPIKTLSSINDLIKNTVQFSLVGSPVQCNFSLAQNLWSAEFDEGQIAQVITNIVINAKQALADNGRIDIATENVTIADNMENTIAPGKYIGISIRDNGSGIPENIIAKIFDPYFTTKPHGSGLGLSTSYSIVKNHGGFMKVESQPGSGSVFTIYLPTGNRRISAMKKTEKANFSGKGRRILLMDDDEMVLIPICEILTELEYEVTAVKSGEEAIEAYKKQMETGKRFDLAILDLVVCGGLGGFEAMQQLLKIDPEIRAIVSSGYSKDRIMAEYEKYGFCGVLAKPYQFGEIGKFLFEMINSQK